jgi:inner membrane protein
MDPVTHLLTGACLGRSGFNRKAAYATLAMTLAAEAPDLDTLWGIRGPVAGFEHHRGITHTFLGLPVEAAFVVAAAWGIHRLRMRRAERRHQQSAAAEQTHAPLTHAPVRWGLLYLFAILALLSHLLLDWTNNYGLRPFFPFNPRWYAGSFVFIVEPVMLVLLAGALIAPALFGLIAGEVGARRERFRGRGWAIAALLGIVALWGLRWVERESALTLAQTGSYGTTEGGVTEALRVWASPAPFNPFVWHTVVETPQFYQLATVDTRRGIVETDPHSDLIDKPPATLATNLAERTWLGRVYLDWSSWPLITDIGPTLLPADLAGDKDQAISNGVTFRDLRFLYDAPTIDWRKNPPLGGEVYIDLPRPQGDRVVAITLGAKVQH